MTERKTKGKLETFLKGLIGKNLSEEDIELAQIALRGNREGKINSRKYINYLCVTLASVGLTIGSMNLIQPNPESHCPDNLDSISKSYFTFIERDGESFENYKTEIENYSFFK